MRKLFSALAVVALVGCATSAVAQIGVQAGVSRDFVKLVDGEDYTELAAPLGGVSYDVVLDDDGIYGMTVGYKGTQSSESSGVGLLISNYLAEYWKVQFNGRLEWFLGGQVETWNRSEAVDGTEFLGGPRGGIRFEVQGVPFEFSGNYSVGQEGREHIGIFFGGRLVN